MTAHNVMAHKVDGGDGVHTQKAMVRVLVLLVLAALLATACGGGGSEQAAAQCEEYKGTVRVGSKDFTEQLILGEILSQLLEANCYQVERKLNLGGTLINHEALVNGEIDLYAEYTGTGLVNILKQESVTDPQAAYDTVKRMYEERWNLHWLEPLGLNNTYALAMEKEDAQRLGISRISDLKDHAGDLTLVSTHEFQERPDGLPGLQETYGFKFGKTRSVDTGLKYQVLVEDQADVMVAFATDGKLAEYDLVVLEDDLRFFPPYYVAPVVRGDVLEKHPELGEILNQLAGRLPDEEARELNRRVEVDGEEPADVARDWLRREDLLP